METQRSWDLLTCVLEFSVKISIQTQAFSWISKVFHRYLLTLRFSASPSHIWCLHTYSVIPELASSVGFISAILLQYELDTAILHRYKAKGQTHFLRAVQLNWSNGGFIPNCKCTHMPRMTFHFLFHFFLIFPVMGIKPSNDGGIIWCFWEFTAD